MAVKYNVVERGKPGDPAAPKKYYPSVTSSEHRPRAFNGASF